MNSKKFAVDDWIQRLALSLGKLAEAQEPYLKEYYKQHPRVHVLSEDGSIEPPAVALGDLRDLYGMACHSHVLGEWRYFAPLDAVLDPRKLTGGQVDHCSAIFEEFKDKTLLPANEAYRDETRKALDRELLFGTTSVLQLDPALEEGLDLLRKQWCAEPSVHGGKNTRIRS